ncbi:hypothetical protein TNCV_1360481 [Trichonephila clavipes]|nr:hypothetical protein TNCV_1360481 [Trichonephila clavipes]
MALAHLSKTLFPVLHRHWRSWYLLSFEKPPSDFTYDLGWSPLSKYNLSFGSSLYPPLSKSLFSGLSPFPKKPRDGSTTRPSFLLIGRTPKSPQGPGLH